MKWTQTLARDQSWTIAYPIVEREARAALVSVGSTEAISTAALVERMWTEAQPRSAGDKAAMQRLYKALAAMAANVMTDCVVRGDPVQGKFGKPIQRNYWFAGMGQKKTANGKTRAEILAQLDPDAAALMQQIWNEQDAIARAKARDVAESQQLENNQPDDAEKWLVED